MPSTWQVTFTVDIVGLVFPTVNVAAGTAITYQTYEFNQSKCNQCTIKQIFGLKLFTIHNIGAIDKKNQVLIESLSHTQTDAEDFKCVCKVFSC